MRDLEDLSGRVFLVSGCSGYLGEHLVDSLIASGGKVVGFDVASPMKDREESDFNFLKADVSQRQDWKLALERCVQNFDGISGMISVSGVGVYSHFSERTDDEISFVMDTNLRGSIWGCIEYLSFVNSLKQKIGSSVVLVSSIYGSVAPKFSIYGEDTQDGSSEVYGATKAGVDGLARYFAIRGAEQNVRFNSISPGGIFCEPSPQSVDFILKYSDRVPLGRMAKVDEIVNPIKFLISDASSYITGHNLIVDGGLSVW